MKVYGKPPLPQCPPKTTTRTTQSNNSTDRNNKPRRTISLADVSQSKSAENFMVPHNSIPRKQSAPVILPSVQAKAKLLHQALSNSSVSKPKPLSASFLRTRKSESSSNSFENDEGGSSTPDSSGDHQSPQFVSKATLSHTTTYGDSKLMKLHNMDTLSSLDDFDDDDDGNEDISPSSDLLIPAYSAIKMKFSENPHIMSLDPPLSNSFLNKLTNNDELLLTQSDNLYREVVTLCQEMDIDQTVENFSTNIMYKFNEVGNFEVPNAQDAFNMCGPELSSLPFPSLFSSLTSSPNPTPRGASECRLPSVSNPTTIIQTSCENPEKSLDEIPNSQSPTSEYDYSKIIGILRMIEDEEAKGSEIASCFGNFLRDKYINSPIDSRRSSYHGTFTLVGSPGPSVSRPLSAGSSIVNSLGGGDQSGTGQFDLNVDQFQQPSNLSSKTPSSISSSPRHGKNSIIQQNIFPTPSVVSHIESRQLDEILQRTPTQFGKTSQVSFDTRSNVVPNSSRSSGSHVSEQFWETSDEKAKNLFSFLDEVEESDRETLFNLKFDNQQSNIETTTFISTPIISSTNHRSRSQVSNTSTSTRRPTSKHGNNGTHETRELSVAKTLDTLVRKGSVELAREVIMLDRQVEDSTHNINILEETLLSQRELNIRNMKSSEKDMKKRLKNQQEEFELTVTRHQAFVDQLIVEKRGLQEKCEKILKTSKDNEEKYQQQIKVLQEKHLEELKRLRKIHESTDKIKKQKWVGQKTQEIRDLTVKGLEPDVQRIIQRHQQEMSETRAYYTDELQEVEERYARKQTHQLQELRENFNREKDEIGRRERELLQKRLDSELQRQAEDFETQKRRLLNDLQVEKDRISIEEIKSREVMQETIRKVQIKNEVEMENLRQEYDVKINNLERRHEKEIQSLRDNFESQRETWMINFSKKNEQILQDRENRLIETINLEKEKEIREREKKLKDEYERIRKEEENVQEARIKRLQDKFQSELDDLEKSERELKQKFSTVKAEVIVKEEEIFSLRTTLGLKEKENHDLTDANIKMLEERVNLTSIIRREFASQIEKLEEDCRGVKSAVIELKTKHKLDLENHQLELEKLQTEKDIEIEKIGYRVKQTLGRKEETLIELQKQLEKNHIRINHLEALLEQQRKDFVQSMTSSTTTKKK